MIDFQKHLLFLSNFTIKKFNESKKLRGMTAIWKKEDNKIYLNFYFEGQISDEELENAQDLGAGIIAHFPNIDLEEKYIRWDFPKLLPSENLAYRNLEEKF